MLYTLSPSSSLTFTVDGMTVAFDSGSVANSVQVEAGRVGTLSNAPATHFTAYGDLFRIGFKSDELLLKSAFVQIPYRSATAPGGGVCSCVARPYYPDPMPWMPDFDEFAVLSNWQQFSNVTPHDTGKYLACQTKRIGYMLCALKTT